MLRRPPRHHRERWFSRYYARNPGRRPLAAELDFKRAEEALEVALADYPRRARSRRAVLKALIRLQRHHGRAQLIKGLAAIAKRAGWSVDTVSRTLDDFAAWNLMEVTKGNGRLPGSPSKGKATVMALHGSISGQPIQEPPRGQPSAIALAIVAEIQAERAGSAIPPDVQAEHHQEQEPAPEPVQDSGLTPERRAAAMAWVESGLGWSLNERYLADPVIKAALMTRDGPGP